MSELEDLIRNALRDDEEPVPEAPGIAGRFMGFAMWWIWYWMVLNRNTALRR